MYQGCSETMINEPVEQVRGEASLLSLLQGGYFLVTGLWPLFSPITFQKVTGPKQDFWLVNTVGVLISVIGGVLSLGGIRKSRSPEVAALAVGSAAGLAGIDVFYVAQKRILPIYLVDALVETGIILSWVLALR